VIVEAWDLKPALADLLADPKRREAMKSAALAFDGQGGGALDDTWAQLLRLLPA